MTKPVALITGASAGLGAEFARQLAKKGYDLILVARDKARLESLAAELSGTQCEVFPADLTKPEERKALEIKIASSAPLDLLVNNAGFGTFGAFHELDIDKEEEEIELNITALVRLSRAALPGMIARGKGQLLNVSSVAGFNPGPFNATYCATKAFVTSFTEALAEEASGTGVHVMALCPGFTRTEFQERSKVKAESIPNIAWQSAAKCVEEALYALERGDVVFVPGALNRVAVAATSITPRAIARKLSGLVIRRL